MDVNQPLSATEPLVCYGQYRIIDFHGNQLLVRSTEEEKNTDFRFYGVKYIDLPVYFENPALGLATSADVEFVQHRLDQPFNQALLELYVFMCEHQRHYVLAMGLEISQNTLPPSESSINRW